MATTVDPFEIVRASWGNRPVTSEVNRYGIDPNTTDGAFECVILGILFAINDTGPQIGMTLNAMRNNGMANINTLATLGNNPQIRANLVGIWNANYFGELYDYPVLQYARDFRCNQNQRQCAQCRITHCTARPLAPLPPLTDDD